MKLKAKLAIGVAAMTAVTVFILGTMTYLQSQAELEKSILRGAGRDLNQLIMGLATALKRTQGDVLFLSQTPALRGVLAVPDQADASARSAAEGDLQQIFAALLQSKPDYWQVRYIDEHGRERVRVDAGEDGVHPVSSDQLQDKAGSDYFIEAMSLPRGALYVSPMNLNREQGRIVTPHMPTIRVAVPVFQPGAQARRGIVIINLRGQALLDAIQAQYGSLYLVNEQGYFLKHPDTAKAFGFDLQQPHLLQNDNPLLASQLLSSEALTEYQGAVAGQDARIHGFKKLHYAPQDPMKYWAAVIEVPAAEAFAPVYALRRDFIGIGLLVVLLGAGGGFVWSRQVSRPLSEITERAGLLAAGEILVKPGRRSRNDEIGVLEDSFNRMAVALQERAEVAERIAAGDLSVEVRLQSDNDVLGKAYQKMLGNLRRLADSAQSVALGDLTVTIPPASDSDQLGLAFSGMLTSLKQVIRELNDGITVLATSSEEVLAATSQVATNTQETATAISEIVTTVDEVKQTAVLASDKAQSVADSTARTREVAQGGRQSVEEALKGMGQIREQMQAVAESIMQLGEQSQTIGEIVASVSDLAEQSNLLGVNASIEAMRAGESGKGFSVVAQEVKALADQSKQATSQVRGILGEIQKAMTKAVLLAEQGSKTVEAGYERAQSSGEAIRALDSSITESSDMALQIAATSQQQMVGMDQVANAMSSIREASQSNVSGTRQMDQATRNLHELGVKLQGLAAQFKL